MTLAAALYPNLGVSLLQVLHMPADLAYELHSHCLSIVKKQR